MGAEGSQVMLVGEPLGGWSDMQPMEAMADGGGHELTLLLPKARFFFFFFFCFTPKQQPSNQTLARVISTGPHVFARACASLAAAEPGAIQSAVQQLGFGFGFGKRV